MCPGTQQVHLSKYKGPQLTAVIVLVHWGETIWDLRRNLASHTSLIGEITVPKFSCWKRGWKKALPQCSWVIWGNQYMGKPEGDLEKRWHIDRIPNFSSRVLLLTIGIIFKVTSVRSFLIYTYTSYWKFTPRSIGKAKSSTIIQLLWHIAIFTVGLKKNQYFKVL